MTRSLLSLVGLIICIGAILLVLNVSVVRKWVYVDNVTGSRRGYCEMPSLVKAGYWEGKSKYEIVLNDLGKYVSNRDYVSCEGTGYNILGMVSIRGHGRPSMASMEIDLVIDGWLARNGKGRLAELFNEDQNAINVVYRESINDIAQQVDSAEASTIAVPPSEPSGSPR